MPLSIDSLILAQLASVPTAGWLTVACYLAAACLSLRAMHVARIGAETSFVRAGPERRARDRTNAYRASILFWGLLALVLLLVGAAAAAGIAERVTDYGRAVAREQGWYHRRFEFEPIFVITVVIAGIAGLGTLLRLTRDLLPRHVPAFAGIVLLACLALARLTSFHDVDAVMAWNGLGGIEVQWVLETAGILFVGACAVLNSAWYGRVALPR